MTGLGSRSRSEDLPGQVCSIATVPRGRKPRTQRTHGTPLHPTNPGQRRASEGLQVVLDKAWRGFRLMHLGEGKCQVPK